MTFVGIGALRVNIIILHFTGISQEDDSIVQIGQ